jgi:hypothetical protein
MYPRFIHPQAAVVWSAATTGSAGNSNTLQAWDCPFVSAFGHVSGATTVTLMYSFDGTTFYAGPSTTLAGASDFHIDATTGAEYLALQSSSSVTATAVISAK